MTPQNPPNPPQTQISFPPKVEAKPAPKPKPEPKRLKGIGVADADLAYENVVLFVESVFDESFMVQPHIRDLMAAVKKGLDAKTGDPVPEPYGYIEPEPEPEPEPKVLKDDTTIPKSKTQS